MGTGRAAASVTCVPCGWTSGCLRLTDLVSVLTASRPLTRPAVSACTVWRQVARLQRSQGWDTIHAMKKTPYADGEIAEERNRSSVNSQGFKEFLPELYTLTQLALSSEHRLKEFWYLLVTAVFLFFLIMCSSGHWLQALKFPILQLIRGKKKKE